MADRKAEMERMRRACQRAVDLANATFGVSRRTAVAVQQEEMSKQNAKGETPSAVFINCEFRNNGKADIAVSGDYKLELHDTICHDSPYGILQQDAPITHASGEQGSSNMKVIQNGNSKIQGKVAGVSVPENSNAVIVQNDDSVISGDIYGIEERSVAATQLRDALPAGVPAGAVDDAIAEVQKVKDGSDAEKHEAVRRSRLWEWIKENGGDIAALVIKVANSAT